MGKWTVEVDGGTCIGSGMCAASAPDHFRLDGATAVPVNATVEPAQAVVDAADSCPMEAILVRDQDGAVVAPTE
ncbi:ferredoxin [Saccharothrix coeruleofusca]|uniref:Ferredoxin n=1 Tax=Saccharothrix coeruleofusca TaxID=33919 RepID=A0A918EBQ1_9PSEU|nr:ferredoxin [Saccharothrix coeruleofusca]MBP2334214.1 ferredoxin [Saccharothrix coeruleofusca]GGP42631.1 hypothetical protein GCM10010185_12670 [Saccharothrix coeruleofusca]